MCWRPVSERTESATACGSDRLESTVLKCNALVLSDTCPQSRAIKASAAEERKRRLADIFAWRMLRIPHADGHRLSPPQRLARAPRTFGERFELSPDELVMYAVAEAAVRAGNHVLASDDLGIAYDPMRHEIGMFDEVGGVAHHTRHQNLALRNLRVLPYLPL